METIITKPGVLTYKNICPVCQIKTIPMGDDYCTKCLHFCFICEDVITYNYYGVCDICIDKDNIT